MVNLSYVIVDTFRCFVVRSNNTFINAPLCK